MKKTKWVSEKNFCIFLKLLKPYQLKPKLKLKNYDRVTISVYKQLVTLPLCQQ